MQTSDKGIAFLRGLENTVLKAYRCPAGAWTIGDGLTAASGVITPKAGMTITFDEATRLLKQALARNYEPRVAKALGPTSQNAFDGGVSFDFNTGAIHRATWVKLFHGGQPQMARSALLAWNKAGGRVLPGLTRRRLEEADIILLNKYPVSVRVSAAKLNDNIPDDGFAAFVISVDATDIERIREGLRSCGYDPGPATGKIVRRAVERLQKDYDLTVDGKIGKATLAALQRKLDARGKTVTAMAATTGGSSLAGGNAALSPAGLSLPESAFDPAIIPVALVTLAFIAVLRLAWLGWHYRDIIAAATAARSPKLSAWLRGF